MSIIQKWIDQLLLSFNAAFQDAFQNTLFMIWNTLIFAEIVQMQALDLIVIALKAYDNVLFYNKYSKKIFVGWFPDSLLSIGYICMSRWVVSSKQWVDIFYSTLTTVVIIDYGSLLCYKNLYNNIFLVIWL